MILTANAKPSKNSKILTKNCAAGVFFEFFVFRATEDCVFSFGDFEKTLDAN